MPERASGRAATKLSHGEGSPVEPPGARASGGVKGRAALQGVLPQPSNALLAKFSFSSWEQLR